MLKDKEIPCRDPVMSVPLRGAKDERPDRKATTRLLTELSPQEARASWLAMRTFVRTGDQLLRVTAKLFFLGVLSKPQAYRLMRIAGRFTEAGLAISPRRRQNRSHSGR